MEISGIIYLLIIDHLNIHTGKLYFLSAGLMFLKENILAQTTKRTK